MIKLKISINIEPTYMKYELEHLFNCDEDVALEFVKLLDIIVTDEYIKERPTNILLSTEEKIRLVTEKRQEILRLMLGHEYTGRDYVNTSESFGAMPDLIEEHMDG